MSRLIVSTIEAQNFIYDSYTTGMTIASDGYVHRAGGYVHKTAAEVEAASNIIALGTTSARKITLVTNELMTSGNVQIGIRVGNAGGILATSIYEYHSWYHSSNTPTLADDKSGDTELAFDAWASTGNKMNYHIEFVRCGDHWIVTGNSFNSESANMMAVRGRIHDVGNIQSISIFPASGTLTSGDVAIHWES